MLYRQEDLEITSKDGSIKGVLVTTTVAKDENTEPSITHNLFKEGDEASATYYGDDGVNEAITKKFGEGYKVWIQASEITQEEDGSSQMLQVAFDADGDPQGARLKIKDAFGSMSYQEIDVDLPQEEAPEQE